MKISDLDNNNNTVSFLLEKWNPKNKKKHKDCVRKVKNMYKVWPSAYASGAVVNCYYNKGSWKNKDN